MELEKNFNPKEIELKWYKYWEENGLFSSKPTREKKPFTIVIPPPNVTGALHMGHALNNTLQDVIIRYRRMKGENALWVPGTDHGGIATQNVVEKLVLKEEKRTRHDLGREEFLKRIWKWRGEAGDRILLQLRRLGCSCDWPRTRFTLDETCSNAVQEAFVRLYNEGLIYRGKRMVNWCPRCHTALADIEVEHKDEKGKLWYVKYPLKAADAARCGREYLIVATTRPETMLGDTAVAVNPEDERYNSCIGATVVLPIVNREIPVIADELVEKEFGTGAVKITPAHDPVDNRIAKKHKLPEVTVIDSNGVMTAEAGEKYAGLDRYACRKMVVGDLESLGLMEKIEDYQHAVGTCYRCHSAIEPLVSDQWFVSMKDMAARAIAESGKVKFHPESWAGPYRVWLEGLEDWCISRQIWWGHRIPVWYCRTCAAVTASKTPLEKCKKCGSGDIYHDPDVLDTWFSSALWPFSILGWPEETGDLKYYYPTSVLVTGYEILYLWVARMVMMGLKFRGEVPFSDVYIHGIVRDIHGKKMSKSLGNVIDPLDVMDEYGTDALRFALTQSATPGRDIQLSFDSFVGARNFSNKIWNASRFILMNVTESDLAEAPGRITSHPGLEAMDKWILAEFNGAAAGITRALENYNLSEAARIAYDFFWSEFCDWYVELVKPRLAAEKSSSTRDAAIKTLLYVHRGVLKLLHPIMPFLTEEIYQMVSGKDGSIMVSSWPAADGFTGFPGAAEELGFIKEVISEIRILRSEMNVLAGKRLEVGINDHGTGKAALVEKYLPDLTLMAKVERLSVSAQKPAYAAGIVCGGVDFYVMLEGIIDVQKELARLGKIREKLEGDIGHLGGRLGDAMFIERAPAEEIEKLKRFKKDNEIKLVRIKSYIDSLK
jgi:valyl-tRNA synthetase